MTVKGINFNNSNKQSAAILASDESILSLSPYKHNGSNNSLNRDSNLNHYKINQVRWHSLFTQARNQEIHEQKSILFGCRI